LARCAWCGSENVLDGRFCLKCGKPIGGSAVPGKCTQCGAINALNMTMCGSCGAPLPEIKEDQAPRNEPHTPCKWCGKPASPGTDVCWECSRRMKDTTFGSTSRKNADGPLAVGAILMVIAGILATIQAFVFIFMGSLVTEMGGSVGISFTCCAFMDIFFGVCGIAGGYLTMRRSNYNLAIAGALAAMLGLGLVVGALLGLVALVLVVSNKEEFA